MTVQRITTHSSTTTSTPVPQKPSNQCCNSRRPRHSNSPSIPVSCTRMQMECREGTGDEELQLLTSCAMLPGQGNFRQGLRNLHAPTADPRLPRSFPASHSPSGRPVMMTTQPHQTQHGGLTAGSSSHPFYTSSGESFACDAARREFVPVAHPPPNAHADPAHRSA